MGLIGPALGAESGRLGPQSALLSSLLPYAMQKHTPYGPEERMPIYETLTILHPDLAEARVKEVLTWMEQLVENGQGKVLQVEEWGMRELAYRIQKQRRGYYVRLEYEATPVALQELERNFRLSEDVIRFLSIVRKAPSDKRPGAQPRSEAVSETEAETPPEAPAESAAESGQPALGPATAQEPAVTPADAGQNAQSKPAEHDEPASPTTS